MEGCAMGQVLHGSARTTAAVRRAIHHSQASLRGLARRHGINPKTVAKWKKRKLAGDLPTGPKAPRSTVLTLEEEAVIVAFRRHTLLPLDDCLYALQPTIPPRPRSGLHGGWRRQGLSRLPEPEAPSPRRSGSSLIRSATSISTLLRCTPKRAGSTSSWPSTARVSSPLLNCTRKPPVAWQATSS